MSTTLSLPEADCIPVESLPLTEVPLSAGVTPEPEELVEEIVVETPLTDTYLSLIEGQNRRMAAYERAIEEERNQLAEMPALIADLLTRLSIETSPDLVDILRAKLEEARAEFVAMQRRVREREASWPARKAEMLGRYRPVPGKACRSWRRSRLSPKRPQRVGATKASVLTRDRQHLASWIVVGSSGRGLPAAITQVRRGASPRDIRAPCEIPETSLIKNVPRKQVLGRAFLIQVFRMVL